MSGIGNLSDPRRVKAMCGYWGDGMSAARVADYLGSTTRNAVIGKVGRLRDKLAASGLTISIVAQALSEGVKETVFDGEEPLGSFALAEIRRALGGQAR